MAEKKQQQQQKKNKNPVVENDGCAHPVADGVGNVREAADGSAEKRRKQRKREREKEERESNEQDPLVFFGTDIMMKIMRNLDARSVALSLLVSRGWHGVAFSDRLWTVKGLECIMRGRA